MFNKEKWPRENFEVLYQYKKMLLIPRVTHMQSNTQ